MVLPFTSKLLFFICYDFLDLIHNYSYERYAIQTQNMCNTLKMQKSVTAFEVNFIKSVFIVDSNIFKNSLEMLSGELKR